MGWLWRAWQLWICRGPDARGERATTGGCPYIGPGNHRGLPLQISFPRPLGERARVRGPFPPMLLLRGGRQRRRLVQFAFVPGTLGGVGRSVLDPALPVLLLQFRPVAQYPGKLGVSPRLGKRQRILKRLAARKEHPKDYQGSSRELKPPPPIGSIRMRSHSKRNRRITLMYLYRNRGEPQSACLFS